MQGLAWWMNICTCHVCICKVQYTIMQCLCTCTGCHSWKNGWMNMTSLIHINHGRTKRSIMIMYHRVTCILGYVLWGQKVTKSNWHEAHMQRYIYVNKGISVTGCSSMLKQETTKRGRSPKWLFERSAFGMNPQNLQMQYHEQLKLVLDCVK